MPSMRSAPAWIVLSLALGSACSERADVPPTGQLSYLRHCASCHGDNGRGDGPVARELSSPPSDLTGLARRNGGRFDERAVMAFIDGERHVAAHGPREMPVWGISFQQRGRDNDQEKEVEARILALVRYLRTLQSD